MFTGKWLTFYFFFSVDHILFRKKPTVTAYQVCCLALSIVDTAGQLLDFFVAPSKAKNATVTLLVFFLLNKCNLTKAISNCQRSLFRKTLSNTSFCRLPLGYMLNNVALAYPKLELLDITTKIMLRDLYTVNRLFSVAIKISD